MTVSDLKRLTTKELTPAQVQLLDFASHLDAGSLYEELHTTLSISMVNELENGATPKAVQSWHFTLKVMLHFHLIAVEKPIK